MTDAAERVLILTPVGRDGPASGELLSKAGLSVHICADLSEVLSALPEGAAAIFVAEEALFGRDLADLERWVTNQPPWSDLPFVILTSHRQDPRVAAWRQRLVGSLGNVSLVERPVHPITLSSTLQAAVRARRRQYEVRALLQARESAADELQRRVDEATAELRQQMVERTHIEEALRQSQKMEAIGQLTGGVAHDFNNLLMVVLAGLEMIERDRHSARFDQLVDGMRNAALRGASLTRQLLGFARRQPLKRQPTDLGRHVAGMRDLLNRSLGSNIELVTDFAANLWPVEVDPTEFELVLLNLAFNARDAMPGGGTITVRAENLSTPRQGGDFIQLTISDTGSGMTPEVVDRAFEPFFTTKEIGKGSGLGLAQAYGFAKETGGTIRIESQIGEGTRVVLILPRSRSIPSPEIGDDRSSRADSHRFAGHVLLVEDDEEVARLVSGMLDQLGYDVEHVANASSALGALRNDRTVDLVFADIMMPGGMDGVGLAREIKARRPDLPVLLTTGNLGAIQDKLEGLKLKVLPKPYRLDDLRVALAEARGARH
jgi:signal transduction histidine kinase/ActR/RegA family two-component response regulator